MLKLPNSQIPFYQVDCLIIDNDPVLPHPIHIDNVIEWAADKDVSETTMHIAYCQETAVLLG